MNINKHLEFMDPASFQHPIHIIGVGAVGSRVAEQIVRLGFPEVHIYDFDTVDDVNVANQLFTTDDIGMLKVHALEKQLKEINPDVNIISYDEGYKKEKLAGAVFITVDSIELRKKIANDNFFNEKIKAIFDGRMRLTDAQYYGADWKYNSDKEALLSTMEFSDEDAEKATPMSACRTSLSVVPTVIMLSSVIVANFIRLVQEKPVQNVALMDPFEGYLDPSIYSKK